MLLAVIIVTIRDSRAKRLALRKSEEESLLDDGEMLPAYEPAPPAYVAELSAGADDVLSNQLDIKATQFGLSGS